MCVCHKPQGAKSHWGGGGGLREFKQRRGLQARLTWCLVRAFMEKILAPEEREKFQIHSGKLQNDATLAQTHPECVWTLLKN